MKIIIFTQKSKKFVRMTVRLFTVLTIITCSMRSPRVQLMASLSGSRHKQNPIDIIKIQTRCVLFNQHSAATLRKSFAQLKIL